MPFPWGCDEPESEVECIRGIYNNDFYWLAAQSLLTLAIIYVIVSMFVVYRYVRDTEQKASQFNFLARFQGQNSKKTMKRSRRVMIQGVLYSVAMLLLYIFIFFYAIVFMIIKRDPFKLQLIATTISPLQGVFNVLIYIIPAFRKKLKTYRQSTKLLLLYRYKYI